MPNLLSIDVSVTDNRIRLAFSDRAVAAAYAAYLRAQDLQPPQCQPVPGYTRAPQLHTATREVSLSLPYFITWFITCRLPDDEDSVTFTFVDAHERYASRWAETMLLFEPIVLPPSTRRSNFKSSPPSSPRHNHLYGGDDDSDVGGPAAAKQLHVRRLWNRTHLLKRLEELRRLVTVTTPPPPPTSPGSVRSRMGSPAMWGNGVVDGVNGVNGVHGARMPVAFSVPGAMQRGDIWW